MTEIQIAFKKEVIKNIEAYKSRIDVPINYFEMGNILTITVDYVDHTSFRKMVFLADGGLVLNICHRDHKYDLHNSDCQIFSESFLKEILEKERINNFMDSIGSESLFKNKVNIGKLLSIRYWLKQEANRLERSVEDLLNLNF